MRNYVCTLEQAIKLKELGVTQDSIFCGYYDVFEYGIKKQGLLFTHDEVYNAENNVSDEYRLVAAAFTLQEILELINKINYVNVDIFFMCNDAYMNYPDTAIDKAAALIKILEKAKQTFIGKLEEEKKK